MGDWILDYFNFHKSPYFILNRRELKEIMKNEKRQMAKEIHP
jgi:uncharacterized protein YutD